MVGVLLALVAAYAGVALLAVLLGRHNHVYLALLLLLPGIELFAGGTSPLRIAGAREPSPREIEYFGGMLERLSGMADLATPELAVIDSTTPNAFAVGRRREAGVVAVTTGLRRVLGHAEVEAVVAHEVAHIANRDASVMTLASPLAVVGGRLFYTPVWPLATLVYGVGALITLTLSRYREYAADRGAALLTGRPEDLMSALVKMSEDLGIAAGDLRGSYALSGFLILPLEPRRFELFMDHPPLEKRLAKLAAFARELGRAR